MSSEMEMPCGQEDLNAIAAEIEILSNLEIEVSKSLREAEASAREREGSLPASLREGKNAPGLKLEIAGPRQVLNRTKYQTSFDYPRLVAHVKQTVGEIVPTGAVVLVVSKGDADLLNLRGRVGWHFPQNELGIYAGYYPPNSAVAISHLEGLRVKGANYIVFPSTALWWLDFYAGFRDHLATLYRKCSEDEDCTIFELAKPQGTPRGPLLGLWKRSASH